MPIKWTTEVHPAVSNMQRLLEKVDRLRLPARSRRDVETILIRQVTKEIDRVLPSHAGHGHRTAEIAVIIGERLGMTADDLHHLKLASYLHDIGLLTLGCGPAERSGFLDGNSYWIIHNHARIGALLLEPFAFLRAASVFIAHHHERWDGTGYPYGIRGQFIPLGARILSVADAFDAIAVPNVDDKKQRDMIALRIIMVASGTQFDPAVVEKLVAVLLHDPDTRQDCLSLND